MRTYGMLREAINRRYESLENFAAALGISRASLSLKLNDHREWKKSEMESACALLDIPLKQIPDYFFYDNDLNSSH